MVISVALLASCGGGDERNDRPLSCSVSDQKSWLRGYFDDWYFWYKISPKPQPSAYANTNDLFNALLYGGTDANFPKDDWSYYGTTEAFNQFFGDGQSMGYGVSVAGREVFKQPALPLYVRYVEPKSPAAAKGVTRGDRVMSINGRSAADIITADDYSALTAESEGQTVSMVLRNGAGIDRTVVVTADVFNLTPALPGQVIYTQQGRKLGYVVVKDMLSQADVPLAQTFAYFKTQGVGDVVIDMRYNGGGIVSVGGKLASYVAGTRGVNNAYATLIYNDRHANYNQSFNFENSSAALNLQRAFVLTGQRTCSASEQVINGLRGVGVQVIAIGDTTCGKPVGFLPQSDSCGTTYSIVNFESVNARNEGRYFDGFQPTCPVSEDWSKPLGATDEPLLAAARTMADGGACPVTAQREQPMSLRRTARGSEPGEHRGMIAR